MNDFVLGDITEVYNCRKRGACSLSIIKHIFRGNSINIDSILKDKSLGQLAFNGNH